MIAKQSITTRLVTAVMTVFLALLSLGAGCPGFIAAGEAAALTHNEATPQAPCAEDAAPANEHPCHDAEEMCPRCAGAVLQDTDIGDLATSPASSFQSPAFAPLLPADWPRPASQTGPSPLAGGHPPPGTLTPVALKTVLLN